MPAQMPQQGFTIYTAEPEDVKTILDFTFYVFLLGLHKIPISTLLFCYFYVLYKTPEM